MSDYQLVVGCEIHTQLKTKTKAFCQCENSFGSMPNSRTCPICLGLPGALPSLSEQHVEKAIRATLALNAQLADCIKMDRKHYVYPDLPKGYQITQLDTPIGENGYLEIVCGDQHYKIDIERIQMEEDSGKVLHFHDGHSYIDFNRAGVPLLEIVSAPQMHTIEQVLAYTQNMKELLQFLDLSDCAMELGEFRCDVNVNLKIHQNAQVYKTPIVEIKNLNSFRSIEQALLYEEKRQRQQFDKDHLTMEQKGKQTMGFNVESGETFFERDKQGLSDYRFIQEPDIRVMALDQQWVKKIAASMPPLPEQVRQQLKEDGLDQAAVQLLMNSKALVNYYQQAKGQVEQPIRLAHWIGSEILGVLNKDKKTIEQFNIDPQQVGILVHYLESGQLSSKLAKQVFEQLLEGSKTVEQIVKAQNLQQISDPDMIFDMVKQVLEENPKSIEDYFNGKDLAIKYLMGQVMKKTQGKADPVLANKILSEQIQNYHK